jgi:2'-5' RNA ligase superfamily
MPDETKFEVDSLWAKPCRTYHVRHEPDQATIRQITELQDQIEATAARELLRVPAHSLHITVLTLFPAAANVAAPDDALWSQHNETWLERIGDVCAATHPFAVEFDSIRASRAIILRGDESANLNYFREKLITAVSLPGWKPTPPNIAHISLFRYARSKHQFETLASIHRYGFVTKTSLRGVTIVQECRYPSLERIFLQRFTLG